MHLGLGGTTLTLYSLQTRPVIHNVHLLEVFSNAIHSNIQHVCQYTRHSTVSVYKSDGVQHCSVCSVDTT